MAYTERYADPPSKQELTRLWSGVLLPPVAWLIDLQISYAIAGWVCRTGNAYVIDVVTVVTLIIAIAGGWISLGTWRDVQDEPEGPTTGRTRLMAIGGLSSSVFFALVIIATAIPNFILRSCP